MTITRIIKHTLISIPRWLVLLEGFLFAVLLLYLTKCPRPEYLS